MERHITAKKAGHWKLRQNNTRNCVIFCLKLSYSVKVIKVKKKVIIFVVLCLIFIDVPIYYLYHALIPPLKEYGKMEVERLNQLIVTHSKFTNEKQYQDMVIIERNGENEITLIDFDMIKANSLANDIVLDIENTYSLIEEGKYKAKDDSYYERRIENVSTSGIVSKVSIATLLDMPLLADVTPKLSIQYKHLASVSSSIVKDVKNYGVNHVMIELSIKISLKLRMIYPFFEQYHVHNVEIPILLEVIEGQVPLVYR